MSTPVHSRVTCMAPGCDVPTTLHWQRRSTPDEWAQFVAACQQRALDLRHVYTDVAFAENVVRAGQAAWWYSLRMPPKRGCRRMLSCAIWSWLVIGDGSGWSGLALAMPWCGLWLL